MNNRPSVQDVIDFENLPEEVKQLVEKIYGAAPSNDDLIEAYKLGYEEGGEDAVAYVEPADTPKDKVILERLQHAKVVR